MALCFLFLDFFFVGKEVGWSTSLKGELWVKWLSLSFPICCFQSLSCVWLCDPMDCSTPGFPVPHHLLELAQAHVHWVGEAIPSSVAPFSSCLQSFPASGSFPFSGETNQMLNFLVKFVFCHNWQVLGNVFITLLLNKNLCIHLLSLCGILTQARLEQDAPECRTVGQSTSSGACSAVNSSHLVMNMPFCLAPSIRTPSLTSKFNPMWVWWEWAQPTKDIRGQIQGLPHSGRVLDVVTQDSESGARTHRCGHLIFFIFWSHGLACRILVPQPGSSGSMESSLDLQGSPEVITSSPSPGSDSQDQMRWQHMLVCGGDTRWGDLFLVIPCGRAPAWAALREAYAGIKGHCTFLSAATSAATMKTQARQQNALVGKFGFVVTSELSLEVVFAGLLPGVAAGTPTDGDSELGSLGMLAEGSVHGLAKSRIRLSNFTFTFHFHALEKEMATHSSVLAWRIPGTGEPGGLPSVGSHRIGHDWSDLAAAAAAAAATLSSHSTLSSYLGRWAWWD